MAKEPTIQFLGAAGTVTGSRYLIDTGTTKILVDAGMFQGNGELRERNFEPFPVPPSEIDAIVLTHGHFDHAGYIPKLVKDGFTGPVYCTKSTGKIAEIVLLDSGKIQELEAKVAARRGRGQLKPALYTVLDAARAVLRFKDVEYDTDFLVAPGIMGRLRPAGHILGSASVDLKLLESGKRVVFSGDLGRNNHPILLPPEAPPDADVMVVESTYGDKKHQTEAEALAQLATGVKKTIARGGTVIIPSFAVDRTEVILRQLGNLMKNGEIPPTPVYVDGRMALAVLDLYREAIANGDSELRKLNNGTDPFDPVGQLHEVRTRTDRQKLMGQKGVIIVASSGMVSGGPVIGHLVQRLEDPKNTVMLAGYQGEDTNGRKLAEGRREIWLDGNQLQVGAEIVQVGFSAHADAPELLQWLGSAKAGMTYPVHGEVKQANGLRQRIMYTLHRLSQVPQYRQQVTVGGSTAPQVQI